jgi:hypothetical protein
MRHGTSGFHKPWGLFFICLSRDSLYRSHNIVMVIKSSRLRWAEHVAIIEEGRCAFKSLTGKSTGK